VFLSAFQGVLSVGEGSKLRCAILFDSSDRSSAKAKNASKRSYRIRTSKTGARARETYHLQDKDHVSNSRGEPHNNDSYTSNIQEEEEAQPLLSHSVQVT
jgi:hypothetical protein